MCVTRLFHVSILWRGAHVQAREPAIETMPQLIIVPPRGTRPRRESFHRARNHFAGRTCWTLRKLRGRDVIKIENRLRVSGTPGELRPATTGDSGEGDGACVDPAGATCRCAGAARASGAGTPPGLRRKAAGAGPCAPAR